MRIINLIEKLLQSFTSRGIDWTTVGQDEQADRSTDGPNPIYLDFVWMRAEDEDREPSRSCARRFKSEAVRRLQDW